MEECESGCAVHNYAAKTSILTINAGGLRALLSSRNTIRKLRKENPGLLDIDAGRARHQISPNNFYFVEKWATADVITDDMLGSFANMSLGQAHEEGTWQELDVVQVSTKTCSSKRFGEILLEMQHSCKSVWKVIGSSDYCTWVPGCKFKRQTQLDSHVQLYMADRSVLSADVGKKEKEMIIDVSVLTEQINGYSGIISLEKLGRASCGINYHFQNSMKDRSLTVCESTFHEIFVPDLYAKMSNK